MRFGYVHGALSGAASLSDLAKRGGLWTRATLDLVTTLFEREWSSLCRVAV